MAATSEIAMEELETLEEDEVMRRLCTDDAVGLTEEEAVRRRQAYGPNIVVHPPQVDSKLLRILLGIALLLRWDYHFRQYKNVAGLESWDYGLLENKYMLFITLNFVLWMTLVVKVVPLVISVGYSPYELAAVILLFVACLAACFVAKHIVDRAKVSVEAKAFALRTKVLRDGMWRDEHAVNLVPGDIIFLKYGDIVPANARVLHRASITTTMGVRRARYADCVGGSLVYYAWTVSSGQGTAVVIATGHGIPRSSMQLSRQRFARPGQLRKGTVAAGTFCVSLLLVGTIAEVVIGFFSHESYKSMLHSYIFMPLISVIPMAMPVVLYLALALGSLRLSSLGIASRGTVGLEDLACVDVMLFNMTGTLTCNKPRFDRDKIEVLADGVDKDNAILLAARASRAHHELYKEPIDEAILGLLDDPKQVTAHIQVIEHHAPFFVVLKPMYQTTYIDENGSKCYVLKGDLATVARQCKCSEEVKEQIWTLTDKLAFDGYHTIAVGLEVNSCSHVVGLLPFKDDLRSDSAKAVDGLIDMGLSIRVLTESPLSITKQVCGRLGKLGLNVLPATSVFKCGIDNIEVLLNINGISNLSPGENISAVQVLTTCFGRRCAMVGYSFLDVDVIRESNIGISIVDAADCTKSESDLVLTQPVLLPVSSAVRISRDICQIMRGYMVYVVSSTVHIVGVRVILLLWNFNLACFLTLVIAAFNHCTSFVMLFERVKSWQSPDRWRTKKIIATGAAFGSYIVLTTTIFFKVAMDADLLPYGFRWESLKRCDEEVTAALFLQMSIVNQAIGLVAQSYNGHSISCPGPFVSSSFIFTQMVATIVAVYGDLGFAGGKGVGWGCAGFIWLYNFVFLSALVLIYHKWNAAKLVKVPMVITSKRLFNTWDAKDTKQLFNTSDNERTMTCLC